MSISARVLAACLLLAPAAEAATFTVSSPNDSGPGTLRQAILDANANPGADQIVFTVPEVTPTSDMPDITGPVAIDGTVGGGRVTIAAGMPTVDCVPGVGFSFAAGSSGSTLTQVAERNYCSSFQVAAGVANVLFTANDLQVGGTAGTDITFTGNSIRIIAVSFGAQRNRLFGNVMQSLHIFSGADHRIGSAGNGNDIDWLFITAASRTIIEGNTFDGGWSPFPPAISIQNSAPPGGSGATITGNTIRNYPDVGIRIFSGSLGSLAFTGVTITGNSIAEVGFPIDLGFDGSTPNDPAPDADTGANNLQNYPVLTSAELSPSQLVVTGTLTSAPLTTYLVELYSNPDAAPAMTTLLASFDVTTDATGNATFTRTIVSPLPSAGHYLTSTATNRLTGDTSEASPSAVIEPPGQLGFAATSYTANESDGSVSIVVQRTGGSGGVVTVNFATANGSAVAPADYQASSGTLTFGPGVTSQTIVIPIAGDLIGEPAETFTVQLSAPTGGATLGTALTTVTISAHTSPEPIPTLSEWSLLALALGLAMAMMLRAR